MKESVIHPSWLKMLSEEFEKDYFKQIGEKIKSDIQQGKIIFPKGSDMFSAFKLTSFDELKVVILGQDPYHGDGQAHGLCFSVPKGIPHPPSLENIFKEIKNDLQMTSEFSHGNLSAWARQGVLLLNAALSVERSLPMSHAHIGWHTFTDYVIHAISKLKSNVVFLLWGAFAQQKKILIDSSKHLILMASHPSPFSAHRGFFGCKHFSQTNTYLSVHQKKTIEWYIS